MRALLGDRRGRAAKILALLVVLPVVLAAVGAVVMLLWNWLMPALFVGVKPVDYWQALGLLLLSKILLGGGAFRGKARQRWDGMSADERNQLRRRLKSRWGGRFSADGADDAPRPAVRPVSTDVPVRDTGDQGGQA